MPNILLASDFDNTLAFDHVVPRENLEAIKRFKEAGNSFAVVSGRSYGIIPEIVKELSDYVVCCNGAYIVDAKGKVIYANPLKHEDVLKTIEICKRIKKNVLIVHDAYSVEYETLAGLPKEFKILYDNVFGDFKDKIDDILNHEIFEVSPNFADKQTFDECLAEIKKITTLDENHNSLVIDINNKGTSKAIGLNKLKEITNLSKIYAIGDDLNDLPMIEAFESFAMKKGNQKVIAAAEYTVNSVAEAIDYILNTI